MFARIAPVYDAMNHLLSLNTDRVWRRRTVCWSLRPTHRRILDIACGTGDLTEALLQAAPRNSLVIGLDFCLPMLRRGTGKTSASFVQGDGLCLPFPDESIDLVTIAFGLRNMEDPSAGLREMHRVLRPGGRVAVLEFTTPANPFVRFGYLLYFRYLLPLIGNIISRSRAYGYLSDSVMDWPSPRQLARIMHRAGLRDVRWRELTFGIAALHLAERK